MKPVFSILIPAIFERLDRLKTLVGHLEDQFTSQDRVEIISVVDNRIVTIGEKRQLVLDSSHGDYVAFVDDDDSISIHYVQSILAAIKVSPGVDVITFNNISNIENHKSICVNMRLKQQNEQARFDDVDGASMPVIKRAAWHTCAWRADLAKQVKFPATSYGEDWAWAEKLNELAQTEHHIPQQLHHYFFKATVSRAAN